MVRISVRGEHTETAPPQRAVVHAWVLLDGPEPRPVHDAVAASVATLRTSIEALLEGGSVSSFSVDQLRMSANRPWNTEGRQLPLVHQGSVNLTVTFTDFTALTAWTSDQADTPGFAVQHLEWKLTDESRAELEHRCRRDAYVDARRRAEDYAAAAGLTDLRLRRITDDTDGGMYFAVAASTKASGQVELAPQEIRVSVAVGVVFKSRG